VKSSRIGISMLALASICSADVVLSETGTLASPEDTFLMAINLATAGNVTLQTYGFGGGTNAAGTVIPSGGFDPFVGLFSGTGPAAVFINGDSDILTNYTPGCPPAGTVTIGSMANQCGDVRLELTGLAAGMYTVLLSDSEYVPNAVFEVAGTLGDGFTDFTGGVFQTCVDANTCIPQPDTANWALDITESSGSAVPEPGALGLAGLGLALAAGASEVLRRFKK
jgi:PEP-CTERM motif